MPVFTHVISNLVFFETKENVGVIIELNSWRRHMKTLYSRETPKLLRGMRDKLNVTVGDQACQMTPELVRSG